MKHGITAESSWGIRNQEGCFSSESKENKRLFARVALKYNQDGNAEATSLLAALHPDSKTEKHKTLFLTTNKNLTTMI